MNTRIWRALGALTVPVFVLAACSSDTDTPSGPTVSPGEVGEVSVPGAGDPEPLPADDSTVDPVTPVETEVPADE